MKSLAFYHLSLGNQWCTMRLHGISSVKKRSWCRRQTALAFARNRTRTLDLKINFVGVVVKRGLCRWAGMGSCLWGQATTLFVGQEQGHNTLMTLIWTQHWVPHLIPRCWSAKICVRIPISPLIWKHPSEAVSSAGQIEPLCNERITLVLGMALSILLFFLISAAYE